MVNWFGKNEEVVEPATDPPSNDDQISEEAPEQVAEQATFGELITEESTVEDTASLVLLSPAHRVISGARSRNGRWTTSQLPMW